MAIIKNSVFGKISGRWAEGVAYELKGQMVLRSLSAPKIDKPSEKQLINRKKFACSQQWLAPIIHFLRIGFMNYQPTFEGFVAAKSYNHNHALQIDENNEFFINPALALVSFGSQPLPHSANAIYTQEQEVIISWDKEGDYAFNDLAMVLLYDPKSPSAYQDPMAGWRKNGTLTLKLPTELRGSEYHVYLAFVSDDRKNRSNSMYLGSLQIS